MKGGVVMSSLGEKALQTIGVDYTPHPYDYQKKGAEAAAIALNIPVDVVFKTLVVALPEREFVYLLAPGGSSVSMKSFARLLQVKSAELATERDAERLTGYKVGGIGPFGARTSLPLYLDLSALDHDLIYINGGRRGLLLGIPTSALIDVVGVELVEVSRAS
ncbi:MAG: Cys-tRNA(Pro) deacylase [Deltaproteobacteria bacterium]|nr:Cys-tRNA(Pro) deacylase [Deltaproteobacteria bacterium]|tara:strand:+ start:4750 stop:5235 length:486 start_codon:yes stop_codon:yes gene_type:complete